MRAVAMRPWLWRSAWRFVPNGWWRRWPPTPRPPADYVRFRMVTAYGDPDHEPPVAEVLAVLRWARRYALGKISKTARDSGIEWG